MQFTDLNLIDPLLRAIHAEGYTTPTPIQEQAIPLILAGRDLIGCAQTGTGKTAAFALPILQHLAKPTAVRQRGVIRALILSPTRELATQIADSFHAYGRNQRTRGLVIFGGVSQVPQVRALRGGPEIIVATPGRLLDLMNQGYINLSAVEIFVLDEADRMFDMGFIHDVRRIVSAVPAKRQTLLFSATMPPDIQALAETILVDPVRVEVTPPATTVEKIEQSVFFVEKQDKRALLQHLLGDDAVKRALVFTRTKHGANKLAEQLDRASIGAEAIHGDKSQGARERALSNFKTGRTRVLIATDLASRGIDVDGVTHVINFDLPNEPESYVHRIGRTARAGASGIAFSFCDADERPFLRQIERITRQRVPVVEEHPFASPLGVPKAALQRQSYDRNEPRGDYRGDRNSTDSNGGSSGPSRGYRGQNNQSNQTSRPRSAAPSGNRDQGGYDNRRPRTNDRPAYGNGYDNGGSSMGGGFVRNQGAAEQGVATAVSDDRGTSSGGQYPRRRSSGPRR